MKRPRITILTDPMPWGRELLYECFRRIGRTVRDAFRPNRNYFYHSKYRGHFAVTRSLVEGFKTIGASFNYNPLYPWQLADTVIVLAGVRTLRQAIRLKNQGRIMKLLAGPNIVIFSSDYDSIAGSPEIDNYIVNSDWTLSLYVADCEALKDRIFAWPSGVDTDYWKSDLTNQRNRILIFDKRRAEDDPGRVKPYVEYLRNAGWQVDVLVRYGELGYTQNHYRDLLRGSCLMVGFTVGSESQGLAWAEAWSCDVPTLILKNTSNVYKGKRYPCSTAPYLCAQNGLFFEDFEHFKTQFNYWKIHREQFTPREWTLANMSDEVSANLLYRRVIASEN